MVFIGFNLLSRILLFGGIDAFEQLSLVSFTVFSPVLINFSTLSFFVLSKLVSSFHLVYIMFPGLMLS
jgi:hypothetical protein